MSIPSSYMSLASFVVCVGRVQGEVGCWLDVLYTLVTFSIGNLTDLAGPKIAKTNEC